MFDIKVSLRRYDDRLALLIWLLDWDRNQPQRLLTTKEFDVSLVLTRA